MNESRSMLSSWSEQSKEFALNYTRQLVYGVIGAVVIGLGGLGYHQYWKHMQAVAQGDLAAALRFVDAPIIPGGKTVVDGDAVQFASAEDKWNHLNKVFAEAYAKNKGSGISGMFLVNQADALINLGKNTQALEVMNEALDRLPSKELKDFYRVKRALMKMDNEGAVVQKEGLEELKKLADNQSSYAHEQALYYLGNYFWVHKDFAQAKNYWQQLVVKYGMRDGQHPSPYVDVVRSKLRLISAEW